MAMEYVFCRMDWLVQKVFMSITDDDVFSEHTLTHTLHVRTLTYARSYAMFRCWVRQQRVLGPDAGEMKTAHAVSTPEERDARVENY